MRAGPVQMPDSTSSNPVNSNQSFVSQTELSRPALGQNRLIDLHNGSVESRAAIGIGVMVLQFGDYPGLNHRD